MKQIVQNLKSGKTQLIDVPSPSCGAGEVLVQTAASLISAGTEKMLMDFAGKSLLGKAKERPDLVRKVIQKMSRDGVADTLKSVFLRLDEPMPLGYSAAGTVIEVGSKLKAEFAVGDRVAMAGAGLANHAEVNAIPRNLVVKLPNNVSFEHGAYATLAAIALNGVRQAGVSIGDRVLVVGLGLVGQLVAQLARAAGAQVAALDTNTSRCKLAEEAGIPLTLNPTDAGTEGTLRAFTHGRGFDSILLCAASDNNTIIEQAAEWARDRAVVVLVGKVGTGFPYAAYMKKELTVKTSRSYGPGRYDPAYEQQGLSYPVGYVPHTERDHLAEVVRQMSLGSLNVGLLTSHNFEFENALKGYDILNGKTKAHSPVMGMLLTYPTVIAPAATPVGNTLVLAPKHGVLNVGVIGTGAFAKGMLLPALAANPLVKLAAFNSKTGLSAATTASRYGGQAVNSADAILADKNIHAVVISTRHNTHAALVKQALLAGKHVWIEKPLAMTRTELAEVAKAHAAATKKYGFTPMLMVGFNRRFAPAVQAIAQSLHSQTGPRSVLVRVNAGRLEDGTWQHSPEGGGRLVGEVCHFTDLALHLQNSAVITSQVIQGGGQDNYTIVMQHQNGGISSVVYSSEGDPAAPKEYAEVLAGGAVYTLNNYQTSTISRAGRVKTLYQKPRAGGTNKGHAAALAAWVNACAGKAEAPVPLAELLASSAITLPE